MFLKYVIKDVSEIRDANFGVCSINKGKGKAVPLQAWSDPERSRKLRFPDFMTTVHPGVTQSVPGS